MTDESRPDPDLLLAAIQKEEAQRRRGQLKIFFGMSAGVGKTYAMLQAAHKDLAEGRDVVIGYVETHGRKETDALTAGIPIIPRRQAEHRGIQLTELDLDALLARKPQLALVDELAHSNAPGSRHPKRYQDVLELLEAGIDVYTSLNVQHVASRSDTVHQITGSTVQEIVPDSVLDLAKIELIDLPTEELLRRLDEGKVYLPDRAEAALFNFFREGNLTALREMALRLTAERVGQDVQDYMQTLQIDGPWKSGHRLMVAVSQSPHSEMMVRWTRRLADSLRCPWLAVYVETSHQATEQDQARLTRHLGLARELGAEVVATTDNDVVRGLLRVAQQHNVTQIVVGKPGGHPLIDFLRGGSPLRRLVRESGNVDLHVVRVDTGDSGPPRRRWTIPREAGWQQYAAALGAVAAVTLANALLDRFIGHRVIGFNFLLSIALLALFVGRGPIFAAATASALLWNFLFLPPRFTFYIKSVEDGMMFGMYFVLALVLGQLIARIRSQEKAERLREERATALYLLTRELADAGSLEEILAKAVARVAAVSRGDAVILLPNAAGELAPHTASSGAQPISEKELGVAAWVHQHNQAAGRFTDNLPLSEALYLPLGTNQGVVGVLGIRLQQTLPPNLGQRHLLDAFVRQIALVVDRSRLQRSAEEARLVAESERLGKTLLDSISHEIRTPIAAIQGALGALQDQKLAARPELQASLHAEIQQAAERLNRLVSNLLNITRLESGHLQPKMEWCDVADLVHVSLKELKEPLGQHRVTIEVSPGLPLVRMDFVLVQQALNNLLMNAAAYTPPGTAIDLHARADGPDLAITVRDHGLGLSPEVAARVFDKFYRAPGSPAGGTGLGLSIVKGFIEAQGGRIALQNQPGEGAAFTIFLPLGEMPAMLPETE